MDCSPAGSSAHGFPRQEYWSGMSFTSLGYLPDPGTEPMSPALAGGFFTTDLPPGKPNDSTLDCVKCYCQQTEGDRLLTKDSAQMDNQVI